ncbi:MAG TPA: Hsp70 family protein, partial [Phytomonospora sp.]
LDVSAVRREPDGYEVVAVEGMPQFGGVDLDAVLVRLLGAGVEPAEWARLLSPTTDEERRRTRTLWDDARAAKEALSRRPNTSVLLPTTGRDLQVGREAFWEAAREYLSGTGELTRKVVARVGAEKLAGLFLVGGSTRMPLVATILHQATGIAPTVLEQPEIVVAEGALQATLPRTEGDAGGVIAASVPSDDLIVLHAPPRPVEPEALPAPVTAAKARAPPPKPRTGRFVAGLIALVLIAAGVSWALENATGDDDPGGTGSSSEDPGGDPGDVDPGGSDAVYEHRADLCDTDLKAVREIAGELVGEPVPSGPTDSGGATSAGCTFTLMKSAAEAFQLMVEADVYPTTSSLGSSVEIAGGEKGELRVDVEGAKAQYAYLKTPAGGYANHVYDMQAVSGNLVLSIDLIGVTSDDLPREDIDKAVAALAKQVMGALSAA